MTKKIVCRICKKSNNLEVLPLDKEYAVVICRNQGCDIGSTAFATRDDLEEFGLLGVRV
jgi:hypothetical protein